MKNLIVYGKNLGIMTLIFIISTLLITILSYFNLIGSKTLSIFEIIVMIITMFIGGFLTGKMSKTKGWLEGLKMGGIFLILLILINIIFIHNFELKNIFYFIILIISSIFGGMVGILKKG